MSCPPNSIVYNTTLCACQPGQLLNFTTQKCNLFMDSSSISTDSGVDYSIGFPATLFDFDSIKKFTQSQAVFLEATLVMLLSWLFFCFFMRFMNLGDGRNVWFKIRWWISRLDISFATRHWVDDQKVVMKRKTELGGTFSMASWILFIGLFAALLYQIISKRSVEVHNIRATNAPDLASFVNDLEFNITTISSMSCSNLRGLDTLVTGNPGFIDERVAPLSGFANYSCHNTSQGPTISIRCNRCKFTLDNLYISWQYVDLPNNPATAVGFQFNLSARNQANKKHVSFVCGTLKNGSSFDDKPVTFRGSSFYESSQLQASLENSNDGLINTTLYVNFLSAYIVEISHQNIVGAVSFLADLGGLYCISIGIFFYLLVQFEYRIKKFRNEDSVLRKIRNRRKAQDHWNKLRKYVNYTWGCNTLDDDYKKPEKKSSCGGFMVQSVHRNGSSRKRNQQNKMDSISFNKKLSLPNAKNATSGRSCSTGVTSCIAGTAPIAEGRMPDSSDATPVKCEVLGSTNNGKQHSVGLCEGGSSRPQSISLVDENVIPLPPTLELEAGSEMNMSDIQKNLRSLYEYNVMLREKLVAAQSLLHALATKSSSPVTDSKTWHY